VPPQLVGISGASLAKNAWTLHVPLAAHRTVHDMFLDVLWAWTPVVATPRAPAMACVQWAPVCVPAMWDTLARSAMFARKIE
jgi:hypothetical protein